MRLDVALIRLHPDLSRRRARDVIEKGQVSVAGATVVEPGTPVAEGSVITWDPHRKARPRARLSLPILYADAALVIVDKPAGLLSVPSSPDATEEDTALLRVEDYARHLSPRRPYVGVVHRIDRGTSGALAFALTPEARSALRTLFRDHRMERRYAVLVEGEPRSDKGVVDLPIRDSYAGGKRGVAKAGEASRPALTRFSVVERFQGAALLDVELGTGRQHQIRVHLAHVGHAVLGDVVYRSEAARRLPLALRRPMLHARILAFTHPLTGTAVRAESPLPADFAQALKTLRSGRKGPPRPLLADALDQLVQGRRRGRELDPHRVGKPLEARPGHDPRRLGRKRRRAVP
jgi:23S rRNA pseudouridine1911/1915/1917 synthase